jgi:glutamine---fructose-6-phosphate transaminase (isomerizing)
MNALHAEIHSLPSLLREVFQPLDDLMREKLGHELCLSLKRLYLTGCGDSHHVTLNTELAFETLSGIPTEPMTALQFGRYAAGFIPQTGPKTNLVVGISVSGEVSRTFEALNMARQHGAATMALTATPGSRVAQAGDILALVPSPAFPAPEGVHVPGVRSFFINQIALLLAAVRIGEVRGKLSTIDAQSVRSDIKKLADSVEKTIELSDPAAQALIKGWEDAKEFVYVGSGPNYGTALFSAAKMLEASGDPSLGQDTEEWGHLQYFARDIPTPTILISAGDRDVSRAIEIATAAKTIGRRVAALAPAKFTQLYDIADRVLPIATGVSEMFSPVITPIPSELLAAYRSELIGEPFFRNFGGGRSVEGGGGISRIRTSETWETWQK